ncbi:MAG: hypothetical protein HDQ95_00780 [Roseburia sp.]|nr:hypothetical protein [Roseburia sp.]
MRSILDERRKDNAVSPGAQMWRIAELLQQNQTIARLIEEDVEKNAERIKLLIRILQGAQNGDREELTRQIYLYGSMLTSKDLMERQLFLWLAAMEQESK